jgi:hypothetical protein
MIQGTLIKIKEEWKENPFLVIVGIFTYAYAIALPVLLILGQHFGKLPS